MARTGRPTTSPASLDRKALVSGMAAIATGTDAIANVRKGVALMRKHSDGFAAATASAMLGGTRRGHVRRAMEAAQNGACFTCGVPLNSAPETMAVLFRLVPSIVGADETVAGVDAMAAGSVPGNVCVTCVTCSADRNAMSDALGTPVCVTADVMHTGDADMLNARNILFVWPAGKGTGSVPAAHVARVHKMGTPGDRMRSRRAARIALLGW